MRFPGFAGRNNFIIEGISNNMEFSGTIGVVGSSTYGAIRSINGDARNLQMAMRLQF